MPTVMFTDAAAEDAAARGVALKELACPVRHTCGRLGVGQDS